MIIKRKKQEQFFILSNETVQNDLESLGAIGLLAYITSLPPDFKLYKTFLFKKFKRAAVTNAWNELVEKKYVVGFIAYIDRHKTYFYLASDFPLTKLEYYEFVDETCSEYLDDNIIPKFIKSIPNNAYEITTDEIQQYSNLLLAINNSSRTTVVNEHIKRNSNNKINKNKRNTSFVNKNPYRYDDEDFINTCQEISNSLYPKYAPGLYSKREWLTVTNQLINEIQKGKLICSDLNAYIESSIKTICIRRKRKLGLAEPTPGYNWLYD